MTKPTQSEWSPGSAGKRETIPEKEGWNGISVRKGAVFFFCVGFCFLLIGGLGGLLAPAVDCPTEVAFFPLSSLFATAALVADATRFDYRSFCSSFLILIFLLFYVIG